LWLLLVQVLVLIGAVITFIPVLWMISGSFKLEKNIFVSPPQWIPDPWTLNSYVEAWHSLPFDRFTLNTLIIVFFSLIGAFLSNTLVAFGFARLRGRGRNLLFLLCLATLMLPQHVTLIPVYVLFSKIGWINTYLPLIVPLFLGSPFWIFMLRQFFMSIPLELDEAARIDGANTLQIYSRIMLPLSKPAITTLVIFVFLDTWRDFFLPLIYLNSQEKFTLAIGLNLLKGTADYNARYDLLMAVSTVMALPPLLLFFFGQKYFVRGLAMTGLKG
jgi:ABC-type glycerol-3-phosphate transport system permease component